MSQNKMVKAATRESALKARDPKTIYQEMVAITNKGLSLQQIS